MEQAPWVHTESFTMFIGVTLSVAAGIAVLDVERDANSANAAIITSIKQVARLGFSVINVHHTPA